MNIIETRRLTRYFGINSAVVDLTLDVPAGSVFGLLGENGSGKTTTINMIVGDLFPSEGTVRVFGQDPAEMPPAVRARLGYVADDMALPGWMRLSEAMALHASYFPDWDCAGARGLMKDFELDAERPFATLSKGQKRRFLLILALAQRPDLLVLDEPAGGLDVSVRRQFLDIITGLAAEREVTILLSSHILTDVERVVDHVAFLKKGRLIRQGALEQMKESMKRLAVRRDRDEASVSERFHVIDLRQEGDTALLVVDDFDPARMNGLDGQVEHLNLEEIFLLCNGREERKERPS